MIRIIAGKWKGQKLRAPSSKVVRPTANKIRGSIFDILEAICKKEKRKSPGFSSVLELYAGSGALGFEALSRGAKYCVFVEKLPSCQDTIEWNRQKLRCKEETFLIRSAAEKSFSLWSKKAPYDLVVLDPPYAQDISLVLKLLLRPKQLRKGGLIVLEHASKQKAKLGEELEFYFQRKHGTATISIYKAGS